MRASGRMAPIATLTTATPTIAAAYPVQLLLGSISRGYRSVPCPSRARRTWGSPEASGVTGVSPVPSLLSVLGDLPKQAGLQGCPLFLPYSAYLGISCSVAGTN